MGSSSYNTNENYTKIAEINALIGSETKSVPADEFIVKYSEKSIKQTRQSAILSVVCTLMLLFTTLLRLPDVNIIRFIIIAGMAIMDGVIFISAEAMKKMSIVARGESLTVKGKTYSHNDISCFQGVAFNNMKLISDGRSLISINKACENCSELVKWAKYYDITIDDDSPADPKKVQSNMAMFVTIIIAASVALGMLIGLKGRM